MTNPNESAFPVVDHISAEDRSVEYGLSKREWFAGMAMIASCAWRSHPAINPLHQKVEDIANESVALADALIAELSRESK